MGKKNRQEYVIGVDLGGMSAKFGLFQKDGTRVDVWTIPTRTEKKGSLIIPDMGASIRERVKMQGLSLKDIYGVGIGVPGAVLEDGIVNRCPNLGWGKTPAQELMENELPGVKMIRIANDANVAALGEMWQGAGKGTKNLCMITLGTGVGGGLVLDGKIVQGAFGAGGEIGHMPVNPEETDVCGCGKRGCLEQYCSASGIIRVTKKMLEETSEPSVLRDREKVTARAIFDAAKEGDAFAQERIAVYADALGRAMATIASVVDPELFLLGGGVSRSGKMLTDPVREAYKKYAFHASRKAKIRVAKLGNDAGMYGAARLVLPE